MSTDRIEKQIFLNAPRTKVWNAISDARQFGAWFGVKFDGPFRAGEWIKGHMTIEAYSHMTMEIQVERVEPERLFSYRWHPYAIDPKQDYSSEPTTLVEFHLADKDGGTQLTVIETGFDKLPSARRDEAFKMNSHGWAAQLKNIERHVTGG